MALTIGNWIIVGIIAIFGILLGVYFYCGDDNFKGAIITLILTFVVCIAFLVVISWYNTSTESGKRSYKDYQSNIDGGIYREIVITAEDGREIFRYEGKIDIETKHEGNANYILFESPEGLRYLIYYGITDTLLIIEKRE